jgi:hypothetical protein
VQSAGLCPLAGALGKKAAADMVSASPARTGRCLSQWRGRIGEKARHFIGCLIDLAQFANFFQLRHWGWAPTGARKSVALNLACVTY